MGIPPRLITFSGRALALSPAGIPAMSGAKSSTGAEHHLGQGTCPNQPQRLQVWL